MASLAPAEKAPAGKPLKVGSPHDPAEREADRIADLLTAPEEPAMPVCAACAAGGAPCAACGGGGGGVLRRQVAAGGDDDSGGEMVAPPSVHRVLSEPGEPLPGGIRGKFERRLGADLGGVRVHRGREAELAATSMGARAFTLGQRVVFGSGSDPLSSSSGMRLLGHELAHTQQVEASSTVRRDDMPDQPRAAGTRGSGVSSEAATPSTVVAAAVMEIAEALRQGDVSGVVAPLRSRGVGEIGDIRRAVHTQTEVWLEQWLVARQRLGESIDLALRLSTGAALLLPAGAVLGQGVSLVQQGSSNSRSRATAEEGIRLLWLALPLIERLEVYDEGFREIEQAQIEVIRSASAAQRTAATTAANSARLNRVLEHLNPKEEFDARVLLDPSWTYDAAERLLRRAPGIISDEDAVFDALIALRPELRRRFFNQHFLALVRLFSVQRFRLVAALVRGSEAEALIIRLRLATEGRIDDQEAIQAVVDRAVALLTERRDLRSALASTSLPAAERSRAEARLRELDDLDRLLSFQRRQGGALAAGSFMGLLAETRGHHEPFAADLTRLAAFVPAEQARDFSFEAAKQRILLMAGDADAISGIIRGVHAPPVEVPADASPIQREGAQYRADVALRQRLLEDPAVRQATRGFIGTERMRLEGAVRADRFDAVVAQLNTSYNSARFGEFFRLVITVARRPDWRHRFQARSAELWGVYARVQGTHRPLMERILASPERLPIDDILPYSGDVELLRTVLAELDEPQRARLRRGYVLSREAGPVGPPTQKDADAMDAYRRFEQQVLGLSVDRADIEAVLDAALGAEPTTEELATPAGRYRAAALLHHRIHAREALGRGESPHFSETDETMLAAAREFQAHWLALGERHTLSTFEYEAFLTLYQRFESRSAEFAAASDAIGEMAGMVAATVAGVLVVAATGGAATFGVIALAAAAGGGSRVVTREMFGDDYYTALSDEGARDALLGAIDAALAVAGASLAARARELMGLGGRELAASAARSAGSVAEQASQSLSRRVLGGAVENAIDEVLSGGVSEAVGAMTDPRAWRRGIYQGLVRVWEAALLGGLMGLAGGAVIGAALPLAGHGIRRSLDAVAARRIETSLARAGLTSSLDAARAAARAGDIALVNRLWADLGAHLGPEDAQLLRRQLYADLEAVLGHPPGTAAAASPEQARLLAQSSSVEDGTSLSSAQREAEIDVVRRSEPRPSNEPGYVDEVEVGNGHTWRRRVDGTWCRFTDPTLCGTRIPGARGISSEALGRVAAAERELEYFRELIEALVQERSRLPLIRERMLANRRAGRPLLDDISAVDLEILSSRVDKDPEEITLPDVAEQVNAIQASRLSKDHRKFQEDVEFKRALEREEAAIRRLREALRDPYQVLRKSSPSGWVRDRVVGRARGLDQASGVAPPSGALDADHVVPLREIYDMPGFARPDPQGRVLSWEDQLEIANDLRNLRAIDRSANRSRKDWSWADWPGRHEHYSPDEVRRMVKEEAAAREYLRGEIERRLPRRGSGPLR